MDAAQFAAFAQQHAQNQLQQQQQQQQQQPQAQQQPQQEQQQQQQQLQLLLQQQHHHLHQQPQQQHLHLQSSVPPQDQQQLHQNTIQQSQHHQQQQQLSEESKIQSQEQLSQMQQQFGQVQSLVPTQQQTTHQQLFSQQAIPTGQNQQTDQLFGGMNMSNLANFSQSLQMMQQQSNLQGSLPFGLMGTSPLQQQLSALSGLTGQLPQVSIFPQNFSQTSGISGFQQNTLPAIQPVGLSSVQQPTFPQQLQTQLPQSSFFPTGLSPQLPQLPQLLQHMGTSNQTQPPQLSGGAPTQLGFNLQQLQQLMAQQLFAPNGQTGATAPPGSISLPAGFNLSALTGLTAASNAVNTPGLTPNASYIPQLSNLAGAFASPQLVTSTGLQSVVTNPVSETSATSLSTINTGFPSLQQDVTESGSKTTLEGEWIEPFAAKGKKEPPFPLKLHQILSNSEFSECVCWNHHGRSWRILKPPVFEQVVIPLYFRHAKYASFMRQVNGWGFKRIVSGNDHNSYYHELFIREVPQLCLKMKRIKRGDIEKIRKDDSSDCNQNSDDIDNDKDDDSPDVLSKQDTSDLTDGGHSKQVQLQSSQSHLESLHTNPAMLQNAQRGLIAQSQTSNCANAANDATFNFLKASGLAGLNQLQGLMGNQATSNTGTINGQNFLQGLIMAGGAHGFNFGNVGMNNMLQSVPSNGFISQESTPSTTPQAANQSSSQHFSSGNAQDHPTSVVLSSNTSVGTSNNTQDGISNNSRTLPSLVGVDSATLAKLQEAIAAAGGASNLFQQQYQPQSNESRSLLNNNMNQNSSANAFANLLTSHLGGQNAALLAAQFQATTQANSRGTEGNPSGDV